MEVAELAEALAQTTLFADLDAAQRRSVAAVARYRVLAPGERVFGEGEYGDSIFVLARGEVEVSVMDERGEARVVERIRGGNGDLGDFFGEMCLLDLEPRSGSVVALTETGVWEINRDDLYWIFGHDKPLQLRVLLAIARVTSRRLAALLGGAEGG